MSRISFQVKEVQEFLRKHGRVYTVRIDGRQEGKVSIYFGRRKVAEGVVTRVGSVTSKTLEDCVPFSGFKNVRDWKEKIDKIFLHKGLTDDLYRNLAIYEVRVIDWCNDSWFDSVFHCPVPGCNFKSSTLSTVKIHFKVNHREYFNFCPICKVRVNVVHHAHRKADEPHLVLFYLLRSGRAGRTELYAKAEKVAERLLSNGFKFGGDFNV